MTLPINAKFDVPQLKAPTPTKNPLWPALTPPAPATTGGTAKPAGEKRQAVKPIGPITLGTAASNRSADGRRRCGIFHGRSLFMRLALPAIPVLSLISIVASGCATEPPAAKSPLDVPRPAAVAAPEPSAPAPFVAEPPAPAAPAAKPAAVTKATPAPAATAKPKLPPVAPAAAATPAPAAGETYTVKPGDTLFQIAKARYGDGNLWKKIAAANPGLSPSTIKVGQKITLPT